MMRRTRCGVLMVTEKSFCSHTCSWPAEIYGTWQYPTPLPVDIFTFPIWHDPVLFYVSSFELFASCLSAFLTWHFHSILSISSYCFCYFEKVKFGNAVKLNLVIRESSVNRLDTSWITGVSGNFVSAPQRDKLWSSPSILRRGSDGPYPRRNMKLTT
jgi:hypothetical protein